MTEPIVKRPGTAVVIACCSPSFHIGLNGQLLGHVPGDLPMFKKLTRGHIVVMGWNTFLSIPGGILPNRVNIVYVNYTRCTPEQKAYLHGCEAEGVIFKFSMNEAIDAGIALSEDRVEDNKVCYVIGGEAMYKYALETDRVGKVILTVAHKSLPKDVGDASFPIDLLDVKSGKWHMVERPLLVDKDGVPSEDIVQIYRHKGN